MRASSPTDFQTTPRSAERPPEVQLAKIEHAVDLPADDRRVALFTRQLDKLAPKCAEDRRTLADLTAGAHKLLEDQGVHEPILSTLVGVAAVSESAQPKDGCLDLFVAYTQLRLGRTLASDTQLPPSDAAALMPAAKPHASDTILCNDRSHWSSMERQNACAGREGIAPGR